MKSSLFILILALFAGSAFAASDETFAQAQAAYDSGRYAEASMLYEEMIRDGISNFEVEYNLANAVFKNGDLPQAVLYYRKAWYQAPRDPDIRANMRFALNAAGAAEPKATAFGKVFNLFSKTAWLRVAIGSYVFLTVLLLLGMLIRAAKRTLKKASLLPATVILIAAGGWWHWHQLQTNPEWVVVKSGATALFGPVDGSTAHYNLPLAAIVRQTSSNAKGWVEIKYDGKIGWLKQEYILRVSP